MIKHLLALALLALVISLTFETGEAFLAGAGKWGAGKRGIKMELEKRSFCRRVVAYCQEPNSYEEQRKKDVMSRVKMVGNEFADYLREENYQRKFLNNKLLDDENEK